MSNEKQNGHCGKCAMSQDNGQNDTETIEIAEDQLEVVAGGGRTQNRYNPHECKNLVGPLMLCKSGPGFFDGFVWCDHYRQSDVLTKVDRGYSREYIIIECVQNGFPKQERYV